MHRKKTAEPLELHHRIVERVTECGDDAHRTVGMLVREANPVADFPELPLRIHAHGLPPREIALAATYMTSACVGVRVREQSRQIRRRFRMLQRSVHASSCRWRRRGMGR
jgi:hypothetical protein